MGLGAALEMTVKEAVLEAIVIGAVLAVIMAVAGADPARGGSNTPL